MKRSLILLMICCLALAAFAGENKNPKATKAAATKAAPAPAASAGSWVTHRFELSFQGGGVLGGNVGEPDLGACVASTIGTPIGSPNSGSGCDENQYLLNNDSLGGLYSGSSSPLRVYQRYGSIRPGNGGVWGVRAGFNITPKWQLEFIYNHARTGTAFSNPEELDDALARFYRTSFDGKHPATFYNGAAGQPQGDQNMYLFNINRFFNAGGRVQPYIGGGLGAESWYAGPVLDVAQGYRGNNSNKARNLAQYIKQSGSDTGFAFDLSAGIKMYMTHNFGVRADVMNVWSFPNLDNRFSSIDASGRYGTPGAIAPVSGSVNQNGKFSQTLFTGGVFWAFGGAMNNPTASGFAAANDNFWDHWELSVGYGFDHGRNFGSRHSTCTPFTGLANGCTIDNIDQLQHGNGFPGGIYRTNIAQILPPALGTGTVLPGDGWNLNSRLAYNFNPKWDVSFIWNLSKTGVQFSNLHELNTAQEAFFDGATGTTPATPPSWTFLNGNDGHPKGTQSIYLVNIDRNFRVSRRFVPYIGAGLGWEHWNGNPFYNVRTDLSGSSMGNVADFVKRVNNESAFAFDIAGGAKYYLSRHFGVRFDVTDVFSYADFHTDFRSIDTSGEWGTPGAVSPVSGQLTSQGHFAQLLTSAGVFWSFGQGGTWKSDYSNTGSGHWDLSFQTGGILGGSLGKLDGGTCSNLAVNGDGCNVNQPLTTQSGGLGVYPPVFGGFRLFQRNNQIQPGDGGFYGVRLGYTITPVWQVEFMFNHAGTATSFVNEDVAQQVIAFTQTDHRTGDEKLVSYLDSNDGSPRGTQNQYLVNLNRKFNVNGRIVPYVGFGGGMVSWYGGPAVNTIVHTPNSSANNGQIQAEAFAGSANGFAFDMATGAKLYIGHNYGVRADFTDVMSFPDLKNVSRTLDLSGFQPVPPGSAVPISGAVKQSGRFNQALFSAGVFWDLGGRNITDGYKSPTGDRESLNDKWEISYTFGAVHGGEWGRSSTTCAPVVTGGCNALQTLNHDGDGGIYPGRLIPALPIFQSEGGVKPGDGWTTGFRAGYNWSPNWQIEMLYNFAGTGTRFENDGLVKAAIASFYSDRGSSNLHTITYVGTNADASPRGIQHQLLFNVNRGFRVNRRIVPYIGAGAGAVVWADNPHLAFTADTSGGAATTSVQQFNKGVGNATAFAIDLAGGLKFYVSRHWGFRADMLNVTSFKDFNLASRSIDISGTGQGVAGGLAPISGNLTQKTRFNQTSGTGGVFVTF